jgi:hypothetical protein
MGASTQPALEFDLSTSEGLIAMVTESLQPRMIRTFEDAGHFPMAVVIIATKFEGKPLATPKSVVVLMSDEENDAAAFLHRTYHWAARECGALGAVTVGRSWAVNFSRPSDAKRWKGRNVRHHPKAVDVLLCRLEHKTFGVQCWVSRVAEGPPHTASAFQAEDDEIPSPTAGFLETLRAVS